MSKYKKASTRAIRKKKLPKIVFWGEEAFPTNTGIGHIDLQKMIPDTFCDECEYGWID